ncbi:hypothetical protein D3C71_1554560 [compost metagenome]
MLKELIHSLMKDSAAAHRVKDGQLEIAGISEIERRALTDALAADRGVMKAEELGVWNSVAESSAIKAL